MLALPLKVSAHDVWMEKKDGYLVVEYGHPGETGSYDVSKVKEVEVYGTDGKVIQSVIKKDGYPVIIQPKGKAALVSLFFDNGFWIKTGDGWENKSKKELPGTDESFSFYSLKYSKTLLEWCNKFSKPLGTDDLELVPLKNPLTAKAGDILPLKIFLYGKPAEGVLINTGGYHKDDVRTDKNGFAEIQIEETGFQIITASVKIPLEDNTDADILSLSANITFEVP